MRIPWYSAEVYVPPVGRAGQGLLQGARARLCAPGVAVGALGRYGVRYGVYGERSYRAMYVVGYDGAGVCLPGCAAFAILYPECVL